MVLSAVLEVRQDIAGNPVVNAEIHRCFDAIGDITIARRFVKRFESLRRDNWEVMNIYRELLVGGFLADNGYRVRHEEPLGPLTPDWFVAGPPPTHVEVVTHYLDNSSRARLERGDIVYIDEEKNLDRIITAVTEKATKYSNLAVGEGRQLIVAVCLEFSSPIPLETVGSRLEGESSLQRFEALSAVLLHKHENGSQQIRVVKIGQGSDLLPLPAPGSR